MGVLPVQYVLYGYSSIQSSNTVRQHDMIENKVEVEKWENESMFPDVPIAHLMVNNGHANRVWQTLSQVETLQLD